MSQRTTFYAKFGHQLLIHIATKQGYNKISFFFVCSVVLIKGIRTKEWVQFLDVWISHHKFTGSVLKLN